MAGFGTQQASYPNGTGALSLGVKWPRREAIHSPPSSAEVKNTWSCASTPSYVYKVWCLIEHGQLYIYLMLTNLLCNTLIPHTCTVSSFIGGHLFSQVIPDMGSENLSSQMIP
jgi:hypothetical protein